MCKSKSFEGKKFVLSRCFGIWDEVTKEATWELEDNMKSYPYMNPGKYNFRGRKFFGLGRM